MKKVKVLKLNRETVLRINEGHLEDAGVKGAGPSYSVGDTCCISVCSWCMSWEPGCGY